MASLNEVKIEIRHRLDQQATEDLGLSMWRGIYAIWFRDALVDQGKTDVTFEQIRTAEIGAQRMAAKIAEEMLGDRASGLRDIS
jgi:hypothetical protein